MNLKRIIGIIICIGGVAMICVSNYIKNQIESGKIQISSAESSVSQGKTLFGLNPVTKEIGNKAVFDPAEQKIAAGKKDIAYYEDLESKLMIGGIIAIVAGAAIAFIPFGQTRRR